MNDKALFGEIWKEIIFEFKHINDLKLEISNYGRVRSFSKLSNGRILKPAMVKGYKIIRIKLYKPRTAKQQQKIDSYRKEIADVVRVRGKLITKLKAKRIQDASYHAMIEQVSQFDKTLSSLKLQYNKDLKSIELKRTINVGELIHRYVAQYFLEKPSAEHCVVCHLDFNKLNNHVSNLRWMTQLESKAYAKNNPAVIKAIELRKLTRNENTKVYKLTTTKVMLIKKKINEGVTLRALSKTFKVTQTQLLRIKRGINWKNVEAAK